MQSVLILGNPNSGKSLLFNKLTGLKQKVANFPGVTVEIRSGQGEGALDSFSFVDFPGVYSLSPLTSDEKVAVESFKLAARSADTSVILYVADATRLERSLYLLLQLQKESRAFKKPIVVAMNVIDEVVSKGAEVNTLELSHQLKIPVIAVSAKTMRGVDDLKKAIKKASSLVMSPESETEFNSESIIDFKTRAKDLAKKYGPTADVILKSQQRLDSFFLSSFWGPLVFFGMMYFIFQSIFTFAAPAMDFLSETVSLLGSWVASHLSEGLIADFVRDAVFQGVGSFVVFVPQIFILFLLIGILEDSGYLARAAILCHRPLSWFGLSGRSFVPLLSGHACAIPAMMAARTIESPRKRFITLMAIPFMTCSARLPVYALLIGAFVPAAFQGLGFFALYFLGLFAGLLISALASRALRKSIDDAPFIVELPPYRWPDFKSIFRQSLYRAWAFLQKAGGIIFVITVVIWFLGYFPYGDGRLEDSFLGWIGHKIEPVFQLMGMDWKIGVALLTSFLAREVFVGTLGTLMGLAENAENTEVLGTTLLTVGMTLPTAISILIFFSLSLQCVSTVAVMRKEMGNSKVPILLYVGYTLVAYFASVTVYQLLLHFS